MALLLRLGVDARGLEPVDQLRAAAVARHPELAGRIVALPAEAHAEANPAAYDGILLSAVLMHIPDSELFDFVIALRRLLRPGGVAVISIPLERDDVDESTGRDAGGRLFVMRGESQVMLFFERLGFVVENHYRRNDAAGRNATWATIVFRYSGEAPRPIDRIESIINRDRKTATYKLALLRALSEIATNTPSLAVPLGSGEVRIPLSEIAQLWAAYYWPFLAGDQPVPQNWNGRGPVRFQSELRALIAVYQSQNGLTSYLWDVQSGRVPSRFDGFHRAAMRQITTALKTGPIRYAGENEFRHAGGFLYVKADLWREFVLMGHWITDSVVLRWAELTATQVDWMSVSGAVERLLTSVDARRQDLTVRSFLADRAAAGTLESAWSGRGIRSAFELDHIIPFALRRDSSIWNLVPATPAENRAKSDKLPTVALLHASEERIVGHWRLIHEWDEARFRADAGRLLPALGNWYNWEKPLLKALEEAVEATAVIRGADRWGGPAA